jgi:hypothetical protein
MNLRNRPRLGPKLTMGVLLILAGTALGLRNLGLFQIYDFWPVFWSAAMLLLGLSLLAQRGPLHLGGHVLIFFGLAFTLGNLGYGWIPDKFWPLGLVWGGVVIVLRSLVRPEPVKPAPAACEDAERGSHE